MARKLEATQAAQTHRPTLFSCLDGPTWSLWSNLSHTKLRRRGSLSSSSASTGAASEPRCIARASLSSAMEPSEAVLFNEDGATLGRDKRRLLELAFLGVQSRAQGMILPDYGGLCGILGG